MKQTDDRRILPWTQLEKQLLVDLHPLMSAPQIAELTGRTLISVHTMASRMGITTGTRNDRPWTATEDRNFFAAFPTTPNKVLAERFSRTYFAISTRGKRQGLRKLGSPERAAWRSDEIEALKHLYMTASPRVLRAKLRKTDLAIQRMAHRLGLRKNPDSDLKYPPEIREVIRLQRQIERKLNDRQHDSDPA